MRRFSCGTWVDDEKDSDGCRPFHGDVDYPQNARRSGTNGEGRGAASYLVPSMCGGLWPRGLEPR